MASKSAARVLCSVPKRSAALNAARSLLPQSSNAAASCSSSPHRGLATIVDAPAGSTQPSNQVPDEPLVLSPLGSDHLGFELSAQEKKGHGPTVEAIGRPIYLDAQATTPVDPRVLDKMLPYLTNQYGNPHSRTHAYGWESEKAAEEAREVCHCLILAQA